MMNAANATPAGRPADPCVMVIFGGAGDLTQRKLAPSLYHLAQHKLLPTQFAVVGVAIDEYDDESFRTRMTESVASASDYDAACWELLRTRFFYVKGAFDDPATYRRLQERIAEAARLASIPANVLYYLAVPPQFFGMIAKQLAAAGLVKKTDDPSGWTRVVVEKPFGRDLDSARA